MKTLVNIVLADSRQSEIDSLLKRERFGILGLQKASRAETMGMTEKKGFHFDEVCFEPIDASFNSSSLAMRVYNKITNYSPQIIVLDPWHIGMGLEPHDYFLRLLEQHREDKKSSIIIYTEAYLHKDEWEEPYKERNFATVQKNDWDKLVKKIKLEVAKRR